MSESWRPNLRHLASDAGLRLLSLVLAIGLWLWVQEGEIEEHKARVRLRWLIPAELVSVRPLPAAAVATFRGSHAAIRRAKEAAPEATIDLAKVGPGAHRVDLAALEIAPLPVSVSITGWNEPVMSIELDERRTRRIPIEPQTTGNLPAGLRIASLSVKPRTVELSGPKTVLDDVRVVPTRPIVLDEVTAGGELPVDLLLPRNVTVDGPFSGVADLVIEQGTDARELDAVPVHVWGAPRWAPASGFESVKVTVSGPAAALRALGGEDVTVFVHLPDGFDGDRYAARASSDGPGYRLLTPRSNELSLEGGPKTIEVVRR